MPSSFLHQNLQAIKEINPNRAEILQKELGAFTLMDLLFLFPFRYVDKTTFSSIKDISSDGESVMLKGTLFNIRHVKGKRSRRLVANLKDGSGIIELVWFQGASWIHTTLEEGMIYTCYGKVNIYNGKKTIPHPELEAIAGGAKVKTKLTMDPVYHSTEKLNAKGLDGKFRKKIIQKIFKKMDRAELYETLDPYLVGKLHLCTRFQSILWIHFPQSQEQLDQATKRIKFEEIFFMQLKILLSKERRKKRLKGFTFESVGSKFLKFYHDKLGFELTGAQKKVMKEIRADLGSGEHMNRLLQGDVGSGKTIVGLMSVLIAIDNGFQACLLAPTEILAYQHYQSITASLKGVGVKAAFLSGSIKGKKRKQLFQFLAQGDIDLLIGTHAILEDPVTFHNLGLAITDEQHRFGVIQRAKLWNKNPEGPPHILVMTATPIPRTLAMTLYGDLEVSVIDELPAGRRPVKTVHMTERHRPEAIEFMHKEIKKGRQIYVVFPLIEESATLDLQNLQTGYDELLQFFPKPDFQISVVHGRMKPQDKEAEMKRFVSHKTQIMVATTVIEVGVNVPNASIMIIENAERFGLSQLHQLRGRVGRGADQSYCLLMTGYKLSKNAKERIQTMCNTNNGFEIAEVDMRLRGHGDIQGTQQSGVSDFKLISLIFDQAIIETARHLALLILDEDPDLSQPNHQLIKAHLQNMKFTIKDWGLIS